MYKLHDSLSYIFILVHHISFNFLILKISTESCITSQTLQLADRDNMDSNEKARNFNFAVIYYTFSSFNILKRFLNDSFFQ